MAVVGPAHSGKSALVNALAGQLHQPARASGEILINGLSCPESKLQPTYFSAWDAALTHLTIEQVLLYTGVCLACFQGIWHSKPGKTTVNVSSCLRHCCASIVLFQAACSTLLHVASAPQASSSSH